MAGLSLGIALRRLDVPVTILEAASYPRHRVCGEFISGISEEELERLGVGDLFEPARRHVTTAWCERGRVWFRGALPTPAYGLSRHFLDDALARRFVDLGGVLECGKRVEADNDGVVWAGGRQKQSGGWVGLKAHCIGLELVADLEIHLNDGSYVGLTRIEGDRVNVCGLFRGTRTEPSLAEACASKGLKELSERISASRVVPGSTKGVSHFSLGWQKAPDGRVCIGDASAMIPPFTGNGMTMALQSGIAAAEFVDEWSRGNVTWSEVRAAVAKSHHRLFSRRLRWATVLQSILIRRPLRRLALGFLASGLIPFDTLYHKVR